MDRETTLETRRSLLNDRHCLQAALAISSVLLALSAVAAIGQLVWSQRIRIYGGCGWDGYFYCAMLRGGTVPEPFNRRILLPFLAKHVETNGLAGFWVVNILSLIMATIVGMYIAWRLRPLEGTRAFAAWGMVPPLLVGAAFLSARNSFHILATYPALSDPLALLLLLSVVALVVLPVIPSTRLLLVPLCFLAPLSREQLAPVLFLALVLAAAMHLVPWLPALVGAAAAVAGGTYAFNQPHSGPSQSTTTTLRLWLDQDFGSWQGFLRFSVMLFLAFGPFVLLSGTIRARGRTRPPVLWLAAVAVIFTAVSAFGGGDTDRILFPAGLLLALAVVVACSASARGLLAISVIGAAYFVQQEPLHAVSGDPAQWLRFFGLRVTTLDTVVKNGLVPSLIALPIAVVGLWLMVFRPRQSAAD